LAILRQRNALDDTLGQAILYGEKARLALAQFADTPWKNALLNTVDFCIARAY